MKGKLNLSCKCVHFQICTKEYIYNVFSKRFAGSSLLNLDDERLTGLVNEEILQEIKDDTILPPFKLSEAATTLLAKIGGSVPSSRKLRSIIRKSVGENNDSDLMEMYGINFIETLSNHLYVKFLSV